MGCVSLACLAQNGHQVVGVDTNPLKVDMINQGKSPIVEAGLAEIIEVQKREGKISATTDSIEAVKTTDLSFICVGTPSGPNGHTDITAIIKVAEEIGKAIRKKETFHTVAIRSTVPPGTNEKITRIIEHTSEKKRNHAFAVVSNPEFLREGSAIKDYYDPPFTLLASESQLAVEKMKEVYQNVKGTIVVSDIRVAEIIKYVNNAFHALKITFTNEIGNICKKLGIDSHKVMEIFCMDKKLNLSSAYLRPGFAYGGSCLPKDLKALKTIVRDLYLECPVIENIERSNEIQKNLVLKQILAFDRRRIGFLGLSFKAGTDDLRNSPIIDIIEQLIGKGFLIRIYDTHVHLSQLIGANRDYILSRIPLISQLITDKIEEIIDHSEVIVIVNKTSDLAEIIDKIGPHQIVYDLVNVGLEKIATSPRYLGIAW